MNWDTAPQELDDLRAQVAALTKDREQERATTLAQFSAIGKELAAAQTQIAQLREALETISDGENWGEDGCWESSSYPDEIAMEALAAPTDTAALDARLKEERERVAHMILNGAFLHTDAPVAVWAREVAAAIREMK
jgi:predicted  nucleic acid-binding Zn-ribbon protein